MQRRIDPFSFARPSACGCPFESTTSGGPRCSQRSTRRATCRAKRRATNPLGGTSTHAPIPLAPTQLQLTLTLQRMDEDDAVDLLEHVLL